MGHQSIDAATAGTDANLTATVSNRVGLAYFEALVRRLGTALEADFACVANLDAASGRLGIVASHATGDDAARWSAALDGPPWPLVRADATLLHADGIAELHPDNPALAGARAGASTPLVDADGRTLGLIAVLGRRPFAQPRMVGFVLELFAERAAAELERLAAERERRRTVVELEASERRYRELYQDIERRAGERLLELQAHQHWVHQMQRQFVYMASHELRTPLAIIDSAAQRVLRRADVIQREELVERIGKIRAAVSRMSYLVDSTLDAARFESGKVTFRPESFDLAALLERVCQQQQELAAHHRIERRFDGLPAAAIGDAGLLEQVFANLISNAVKYSPEADSIEVGAHGNAARVIVTVRDRGVGIPVQELPRLFERFYRASTAVGIPGTGIGLNIARQIVDLHGGIIAVDSTVGAGTTFSVKLPLPEAD